VLDPAEKRAALDAIVEHSVRGRAAEARPPNELELTATRVLALPIQEASAKIRSGPPIDDPDDLAYPAWAGVIPLRAAPGAPIPVSESPADRQPSACVRKRATDQVWPIREERREELLLTTDVARLDVDTIHRFLSEGSYWAQGVTPDAIERALRGSLCVGVLRPEASDELVGFARAATDGATFVYLMDVFVLEAYRGRGIGKWLIGFLRGLPEHWMEMVVR
jgi:GNAT superfamily N-acetyltransferase